MSANGHLKFQGTNRATFVGETSNIMFDTTTTSLGIGVTGTDHPSSNLYITGNAYISNSISVGGVLTMGTVNVVARHDLESVTATGNITPLTVEFQNADTSLVTTGNVEVGKELTVTGNATVSSNLTVSGNVEVGTANLFVDTVNSRVGVGTTSPGEKLQIVGDSIAMSSGPTSDNYGQLSLTSVSNYTGGSKPTQLKFGIDHTVGSFGRGFIQGIVDSIHAGIDLCLCPKGGNVGVGTSTPGQKLSIYTGSTSTPALSFDRYPTDNYRTDIYQDTNGPDFRVGYGSYTPSRVLYLKRYSNGNKGVEIDARLLTFKQGNRPGASTNTHGIKMENTDNTNYWNLFISNNDHFRFAYNGGAKGYVDQNDGNAQMNFTGQHRTFIKDTPFTEAENLEGLIVSADQNKYIKMSGGIETGSNAITMNETLPVVSLSVTAKDKKCFGVISASEDPESRTEQYGVFGSNFEKEKGDTRVYINSVGEGAIWVTNINGPLESGDYITTSAIKGYGQKQDSEFLTNYTVAKITMDCDFEPVTQPVQVIKKDEEGENILDEHGQIQWEDHPTETEKAYKIRYLDADGNITDEASAVHKAAFVGCTYHCG